MTKREKAFRAKCKRLMGKAGMSKKIIEETMLQLEAEKEEARNQLQLEKYEATDTDFRDPFLSPN